MLSQRMILKVSGLPTISEEFCRLNLVLSLIDVSIKIIKIKFEIIILQIRPRDDK